MGFTTYEFYTTEYMGDSVAESSFDKWNVRASDKLQFLCFGRINEEELIDYSTEIQKATCALIDLLYKIDFMSNNTSNPEVANVKSMSSGGQSVSFGSNETVISKVLSDSVAQERLMRDSVSQYLANTGLLYVGVM